MIFDLLNEMAGFCSAIFTYALVYDVLYLEGNNKIIDEMAVIKAIDDNKSATKELMNCSEGTVVYHTTNENITIEVKNIRAYRGRI